MCSPQEKQEKELKQSTEEVKLEKEKTKEREVQCRAQEKYKEWLRRKDQERLEKKKNDKVIHLPVVFFFPLSPVRPSS